MKWFSWKVNGDVVRFVMELTTNQWLYRHFVIERELFIIDRTVDVVSVMMFVSNFSRSVSLFVCLVLYIIFRLISLVLYYTKLCKCYTVRTVIPFILSVLVYTVSTVVLNQFNLSKSVHCPVPTWVLTSVTLGGLCIIYVYPILWIVRKFTFVDEDIFLHQVKSRSFLNIFIRRWSRSDFMYFDGCLTIISIMMFPFIYQVSVSWFVCLIIFIILRLISFKLSYITKPYKFYAYWNVKVWFISACLCFVPALVSLVLNYEKNTCSAITANHTLPSNSTNVNSSLQYMEREYFDFTLTTISSSFYDNSSQNSLY